MADRQVKATLSVQMQQYVDGMNTAAKATRETASEASKLNQQHESFQLLGRTALIAGGAMAAGLAVAVAKFADFDQAMSNVQAATHETAENMELLRDAALEAGATTVFSATESANAIEELAKAGLSAADILGGALAGSLDLAAASGIGVAEAAEIAATTMQQFQLDGDKAVHVADLLAAGAGKAMGDVTDMAQALKQAGLVANQFDISVEETTGTLSAFASAGLLGSDSGTAFRTMLLRLANPTKEVTELMEEIGFSAYDAGGNFIGMTGLAHELETSLFGMTEQQKQTTLAMIFGQDAIRGATVLYEEGAAGISQWTREVDDAGYAADTAATRLDNLAGDWEALSGAVDTALISMGEAADGPLRFFVQQITELVDAFNEMPAGGQQAVFWVTAVGAAATTALGAYLLLVPKVAEFNTALDVLGPKAAKAARGIGLVAKAGSGFVAGAAVAVVGADLLTDALAAVGDSAEVTGNKVKTAKDAVDLLDAGNSALSTSNIKLAAEQIRGLGDALDGVGSDGTGGIVSATTITSIRQLGQEFADLASTDLPAAQRQFALLADEAGLSEKQQKKLLDQMEPYKKALTDQATETDDVADSQWLLNEAMGESEPAAKSAADGIAAIAEQAEFAEGYLSDMEDALRGVAGLALEMGEASDAAQGAINALGEAAKAEEVTLKGTNDASIALRDSMREVETSHRDAADAILQNGGTLEDARLEWEKGREAVINMRTSMGEGRDEAILWADQNLGSAAEVEEGMANLKIAVDEATQAKTISITADDSAARNVINRLISFANGVQVVVPTRGSANWQGPGRAYGGAITGPGGPVDDSAGLYALSNGEHVLTSADVDRMGGQHAVYAFRNSLHDGGGAAGTGGGVASVTNNIFPAEGMSEENIGRIAAEKTDFALRGIG